MLTEIKNSTSFPALLNEKFSVVIINREGIIVYANRLFSELSRYKNDALMNEHINIVTTHSDFKVFRDGLLNDLKNQSTVQRTIKRLKQCGEYFWVQATFMPIYDKEDRIQQLVSFEIDITDEIQTKEKYTETLHELKNIENALNQSTVVVITDRRGRITYANEKFCRLSKYSAEELIGQNHRIVNSNHHPSSFFQNMWRTIASGNIWAGDIKNRAKDGSMYWVKTTVIPFLDKNHEPEQYIAIRTDITDQKKAEEDLGIALKNDFKNTVKNLQNAVFKYTCNQQNEISFTLLEGMLTKKLNVSLTDLNENHLLQKSSPEKIKRYRRLLLRAMKGKASHFEFPYLTYTFLIYLSPILQDDKVTEVVGTISDITDRKKAENDIRKMAYYDFLTGLPNRRLLEKKMDEAIQTSKRTAEPFGVMFIDINEFKSVNDSLGHSVGDELLKQLASRIQQIVGNRAFVGRLGGDEFVILLPSASKTVASDIANCLISGLEDPFIIHNNKIFINSSIGISIYPKDGKTSSELIRNADIAMFQIKDEGSNSFHFFTEALHEKMIQKAKLTQDLRMAIQKNQLELYYQPQIDLTTGIASGVEALVRWNHPLYGMISPAQFIPIAEETGLIIPIGQWVLETACMQAKQWHLEGLPPIHMSVNVSPREFRQASFVQQVQNALASSQLDPQLLNIEITESMMSDVQYCRVILKDLRQLGVAVSVDDFGTGYSSLSYLNSFPLTHLKIDQAFIRELNETNHAIVKTIINLAANLNLTVIAEGVETEEQASVLHSLSCYNVQGFLYSKPLPYKKIEPLLRSKF